MTISASPEENEVLVCGWCLMRRLVQAALQAQWDQNEQTRPELAEQS